MRTYRMRAKAWKRQPIAAGTGTIIATSSGPCAAWSRRVRGRCWLKYHSNSARRGIFRRRGGSKLIALTLSTAPAGFARWSCVCSRRRSSETAHCRARPRQHYRADAKKEHSSGIASSNCVIPPDSNASFCRHHGRRPWKSIATVTTAAARSCASRNLEGSADHRTLAPDPRQTWTTIAPITN